MVAWNQDLWLPFPSLSFSVGFAPLSVSNRDQGKPIVGGVPVIPGLVVDLDSSNEHFCGCACQVDDATRLALFGTLAGGSVTNVAIVDIAHISMSERTPWTVYVLAGVPCGSAWVLLLLLELTRIIPRVSHSLRLAALNRPYLRTRRHNLHAPPPSKKPSPRLATREGAGPHIPSRPVLLLFSSTVFHSILGAPCVR
jgi:hypothetical protein